MRVLLLTDRSFAQREHAMLRRLEVGLVDEGVRLVRATPLGAMSEPTTGLAGTITYDDALWRLIILRPTRAIARALTSLDQPAIHTDESPIDLIHAFGEGCWTIAAELAESFSADLALEVWSRASLSRIATLESRAKALDRAGSSVMWLAPDKAMQSAAERHARRWSVACSNWGVHVPSEDPTASHPSRPVRSVCIMSSGHEPAILMRLLEGFARATAGRDDAMLFADAEAARKLPAVWRHASALGLLPRLSLVPDMESRRELVLQTDALVQPEALGEHRTLMLEAAAAGMLLITRADRLVELAGLDGTSLTIAEPSVEAWEQAFRTLLESPDRARAIGHAGRAYIRAKRLAHQQVKATLDAYSQAMSGNPIPIASA